MDLTQNKIDILSQNLRKKRLKVEILDYNMKMVDEIEGYVINGSINVNADNDIRRSGEIEMVIPVQADATRLLDQLSGFTIEIGGKIWIDKYVKLFVGIDDDRIVGKTEWYNLGVFLINNPSRNFSADNFTLSFSCIDLMAKITGLRKGQLTGIGTVIPRLEEKLIKSDNLFNINDEVGTSVTRKGLTVTVNSDYTLTLNGTALQDAYFNLFEGIAKKQTTTDNQNYLPLTNTDFYIESLYCLSGTANNANSEPIGNVTFCSSTGAISFSVVSVDITNGNTGTPFMPLYGKINNGYIKINAGSTFSNFKLGIMVSNDENLNFLKNTTTEPIPVIDFVPPFAQYFEPYNGVVKTKTVEVLERVIRELAGFTKYAIYPIPQQNKYIPYDIKVGIGATVYDILKEVMNTLSTWQMYFDVDGILRIEPIPSGTQSMTHEVEVQHYISNSLNENFENVKNEVVVYGRTNTLAYYSTPEGDNNSLVGFDYNNYTRVEYIRCVGEKYIDLNMVPNSNTRIQIKFKVGNTADNGAFVFGAGGTAYNDNAFELYPWSGNWNLNFGDQQFAPRATTDIWQLDLNKGNVFLTNLNNGESYKHRFDSVTIPTMSLFLFALNRENGIIYGEDTAIYECIVSQNGEVIRNLIPCKDNNGNMGFYDIKNYVFYGANGTGTIYAGDEIEKPPIYYSKNVDEDSYSLNIRYSAIDIDRVVVGATTFGFLSPLLTNNMPVTKVNIYVDSTIALSGNLVKFENAKTSFGVDYETTQIEVGGIEPNELCFIRLFDASLDEDGKVDVSKPLIFEYMGKQMSSYALINDNTESPFYINSTIQGPNFYAGTALTSDGSYVNGQKYVLRLNNKEPMTELEIGTYITFMANATNSYGLSGFTEVDVVDAFGTLLVEGLPIVQNKWADGDVQTRLPIAEAQITNDYTVCGLRYERYRESDWFVLEKSGIDALVKVLEGGEYDNIFSDQLAYERCLYELYLTSNLNDSVTLGIVPNYLLDVNYKIAYDTNDTLPKNIYDVERFNTSGDEGFDTSETKDLYVKKVNKQNYLIKQITFPLGLDTSEQVISAIRIYDSGGILPDN